MVHFKWTLAICLCFAVTLSTQREIGFVDEIDARQQEKEQRLAKLSVLPGPKQREAEVQDAAEEKKPLNLDEGSPLSLEEVQQALSYFLKNLDENIRSGKLDLNKLYNSKTLNGELGHVPLPDIENSLDEMDDTDFMMLQFLQQSDEDNFQNYGVAENSDTKKSEGGLQDISDYFNDIVSDTKRKLQENHINEVYMATNPPTTLDLIPFVKYKFYPIKVSGVQSLQQLNGSRGYYYSRMYAFGKHQFDELQFTYILETTYFGIIPVYQLVTIVLSEATAQIYAIIEKDKTTRILQYEFKDAELDIRTSNDVSNFLYNDVVGMLHSVVKDKIIQVCSRDMRLLITKYVNESQ